MRFSLAACLGLLALAAPALATDGSGTCEAGGCHAEAQAGVSLMQTKPGKHHKEHKHKNSTKVLHAEAARSARPRALVMKTQVNTTCGCDVEVFRSGQEDCKGKPGATFSTMNTVGEEKMFDDNNWVAAKVTGDCIAVTFYDDDFSWSVQNVEKTGPVACYAFENDLNNDMSGVNVLALESENSKKILHAKNSTKVLVAQNSTIILHPHAKRRPRPRALAMKTQDNTTCGCDVKLYRGGQEDCSGKPGATFSTMNSAGEEKILDDNNWVAAKVEGDCIKVTFYDDDWSWRLQNVDKVGQLACYAFESDLKNDMSGVYVTP